MKKTLSGKKMNIFIRLAIGAFIIFCVLFVLNTQLEYNRLQQKKNDLEKTVGDYNISIDKLKNELNTPIDEDYIVRVAKERLNLRLPEEIIFYNDRIK